MVIVSLFHRFNAFFPKNQLKQYSPRHHRKNYSVVTSTPLTGKFIPDAMCGDLSALRMLLQGSAESAFLSPYVFQSPAFQPRRHLRFLFNMPRQWYLQERSSNRRQLHRRSKPTLNHSKVSRRKRAQSVSRLDPFRLNCLCDDCHT